MAFLRGALTLAVLLTPFAWSAGCSLVLDPDDLTAELRDGSSDTTADVTDTGVADGADGVGEDADVTPDSGATDTGVAVDTDEADTLDTVTPPDTAQPDTEVADTSVTDTELPDTTVTDTETPDTVIVDTTVDTTDPGPNVIITKSGAAGCELDYETQLLDLTECPKTCPSHDGWTLVFDATQSTGVTSYEWTFSATNSYRVTPSTSQDGRVEVTLDVPSCDLFSGTSLGSAKVYGFLNVNGDTDKEYSANIDFSVRYVSNCGSSQGTCEPPP